MELATCGIATWIIGTAEEAVPPAAVCPRVNNCGAPGFSPRTGVVSMGMRAVFAVERICGVSMVVAPPGRDAGMYVTGDRKDGHPTPPWPITCTPAAAAAAATPPCATAVEGTVTTVNWDLRSVFWVGNVVGVVSVVMPAAVGETEREEEAGMVETGTVKARAMSELWATGDVAVCAVVSFSFFLHLALRFWNHTCAEKN